MARIAFFLLLALAIYVGWRLFKARQLPRKESDNGVPRLPMVSCAKCGLHVPRSEALSEGDRYFCCEEHRRAGPDRPQADP